MIKKTILGIILSGILIYPAYAGDCDQPCDSGNSCNDEVASTQECDSSCQGDKVISHHASMPDWMMHAIMPSNPLDAEAKEFIVDDVKRIAILPFSDYSSISPLPSESGTYWASRRIHDFMSAEFLKMGKLVVPYDMMTGALAEIRGVKASELTGMAFLQKQMTSLAVSGEAQKTVAEVMVKGGQVSSAEHVYSLDLTAAEIVLLGQALNVDAIFMGSISDYGTDKYIKADARTFIPPFLGVWNPSQKAQIRMLVYLYETENGQLIWSSMEETSYEPSFPLFSSTNKNYEKLNRRLAENIVNHFRDVFINMRYMGRFKPSPTGGPGTVRREKDIRIIMKQE